MGRNLGFTNVSKAEARYGPFLQDMGLWGSCR